MYHQATRNKGQPPPQTNPVCVGCGNENLQYLLVPARLDAAMAAIDTDSDGEITAIEWRVSESEISGRLRRGGGVLDLLLPRPRRRVGVLAPRQRSERRDAGAEPVPLCVSD